MEGEMEKAAEVWSYELHIVPPPQGYGRTSGWVFTYGGRDGRTAEEAFGISQIFARGLTRRGIPFRREHRRLGRRLIEVDREMYSSIDWLDLTGRIESILDWHAQGLYCVNPHLQ